MANCPNCGSSSIALKNETEVDWGRAIAGYALFGIIGGAVGSVTGEDSSANVCLNCGTSWKAAYLYKLIQTVKKFTGVTLDLSKEKNRIYLDKFMIEIEPCIQAMYRAEKEVDRLKTQIQILLAENNNDIVWILGISLPFAFFIFAQNNLAFEVLILSTISILLGSVALGMYIKEIKINIRKSKIEKLEKEITTIRLEIKQKSQRKISTFLINNPL